MDEHFPLGFVLDLKTHPPMVTHVTRFSFAMQQGIHVADALQYITNTI